MEDKHDHAKMHGDIINKLYKELEPIFEMSDQAIYLYLDDANKRCNKKFAALLGYDSAEEWSHISLPFAQTFVASKSQKTLVSTYQKAIEHLVGSHVKVTWKRMDGKEVDTEVILVPITYQGHQFALHFISI